MGTISGIASVRFRPDLGKVFSVQQAPTTIRTSILSEFRRLALSLNLDPIALMRRSGIHRRFLDDSDLTFPMHQLNELLELTALTSGIEDFGIRLAESRGLPDLGPVTLMLREEDNLRAALRTLIAYFHLHSDAAYLNLQEDGEPTLAIDIMMEGVGHRRQAIDASVGSITTMLRWLLDDDWSPAAVCFAHSRPSCTGRHQRFFRCPIYFNHEFNGIVLHKRDLDQKLTSSSPAMRRQVQRFIRSINVTPSRTYLHRVTQVIALALPRGEGRAETIATYLGTAPRTLNRRLARNGLNYSAVLESTRRNLAIQYMRDGERPLSDIAGLVGFNSLSAFSSWFRHAFDCPPSVWRKQQSETEETLPE